MGTEEAILYSYDLATLPSILPAFANKKDLILCDEVGSSRARKRPQKRGEERGSMSRRGCMRTWPFSRAAPVCLHHCLGHWRMWLKLPSLFSSPLPPPLHPPHQGVNYAIQNGASLSRAKVIHFKHNDLQHLEQLLQAQEETDRRQR